MSYDFWVSNTPWNFGLPPFQCTVSKHLSNYFTCNVVQASKAHTKKPPFLWLWIHSYLNTLCLLLSLLFNSSSKFPFDDLWILLLLSILFWSHSWNILKVWTAEIYMDNEFTITPKSYRTVLLGDFLGRIYGEW